jgi:hypothetical protein
MMGRRHKHEHIWDDDDGFLFLGVANKPFHLWTFEEFEQHQARSQKEHEDLPAAYAAFIAKYETRHEELLKAGSLLELLKTVASSRIGSWVILALSSVAIGLCIRNCKRSKVRAPRLHTSHKRNFPHAPVKAERAGLPLSAARRRTPPHPAARHGTCLAHVPCPSPCSERGPLRGSCPFALLCFARRPQKKLYFDDGERPSAFRRGTVRTGKVD